MYFCCVRSILQIKKQGLDFLSRLFGIFRPNREFFIRVDLSITGEVLHILSSTDFNFLVK